MIQPVNRYIEVVVPTTLNPGDTTILLPADFKPQEERYKVVKIQSWAPDVRFAERLSIGCEALVDHSMVEEIKIGNRLITIVQDNYIIALLTE
mgnify:CR=1 FL=1|tara:strand:- start:3375 stop:3653 length:279 start_codon:yes stop_codon:yes gene_type:complete